MKMSVLLVQLAGQRIALPATEVDSVIELGKITPVPGTPPHIVGLATLRSRALTVIDFAQVLGLNDYQNTDFQRSVVFKFEGHDYAMLVDVVEDVTEADIDPVSVPGGVGEIWSKISDGLIETDGGSAMLIKTDTFIKTISQDTLRVSSGLGDMVQ